MAGVLATLIYKNPDATLKPLACWDMSGYGNGPFIPIHQLSDASGNQITPAQDSTVETVAEILANILTAVVGRPSVADANSAPFTTAVAMTAGGSSVAPGRAVEIICTTAGNVSLQLSGGSAHVIPVVIGRQVVPFAATGINSGANTTAVAAYANLS